MRRAAAASCEGWMTQVVPRTDVTAAHSSALHACVVALASPMLVLRVPAVHALAVHACVMRACASHARVACTCCSCPCCACPRCARSCGACGVLVQRSPTPCGARRHRRQHTPDQPLVDPVDLTCHFPILSPIALLLLDHMHVPAMLH